LGGQCDPIEAHQIKIITFWFILEN
jgi:hypothetical protein